MIKNNCVYCGQPRGNNKAFCSEICKILHEKEVKKIKLEA